ncbi:NEDD4-binding protein 2-like 2 isoform X2 [Nycticebus coucang]|uniref:NEDD4-binding protein 2-like 2 isoform X2 n=1 Tax=Nycticebus coucang TaxID=9470 RepID=UPI00234C4C06|nr:NEDD4-binding protein 2-like 2 isoform X2 [Nycticebus coucang]
MPYDEIEAKFLGPREEVTSEPRYKKLKSTAEAYIFPHHTSADFHKNQEKTGNGWVPVSITDVRGCSSFQEEKTKTTDLLRPLHDVVPANRSDVVASIDSQVLQVAGPPLLSTDDGIYSTSKAFIGPIYKPPEKKKCKERRNKADDLTGINDKGGQKEKQKLKKSEIDDELFQFYKEIEELENEKEDLENNCKEPELPQEQFMPYYQGHNNDLLKSDEEKKELSNALQLHCGYQQSLEDDPSKYPCNGQVITTFCDFPFTSFRPEWQSMHPFIEPHGPPLPSLNYHLNIQRFTAPPNPPLSIFQAQDDCQMQNGYFVDSCNVNWNCLTFDQSSEYTDYCETSSSIHPSRNDCSMQGGYMSNGFCEIREGYWKDLSMDKHNATDRFVNQHFQEEKLNKLQKILILLRGLPGSGKTTLSRILLGQSRDGIVFSTDDYFHHQDGYRYNVNQLGDAHDWNQNRAKQAIDQGRSPVIIDNTNTQAWEMKPYVEMAIGKGYRVEFHEPETWWKFDPEELEKRNKHGVSRKKIAQMLDRYEYQMSISIVMNSVEPSHKSTQRPLPPDGRQRERVLKKTVHSLSKTKQKRNRNRNKKQNTQSKIMEENSFKILSYLTPGDQDPSQSEEEEIRREAKERPFTGGLQNEVGASVNGHKENRWKTVDPEDSFPNVISRVELESTPKNYLRKEGDDWFLTVSSMPNKCSVTCPILTQNRSCDTSDDCPGMKVAKHIGNRHTRGLGIQDLFAEPPFSFMKKKEVIGKSHPDEPMLCHQHGSRTSDKVLIEKQRLQETKNSDWAFFTASLSDEDLQLGSDSQPYFAGWPEGPHKFACEQRSKKDRSCKLACPDGREQLISLISTSVGTSGSGSISESMMEKLLIENEDFSPPPGTINSFIETETSIFKSCLPQPDMPESVLQSTKNKKQRQKSIFSLAPNFNLLGQNHTNAKQREEHDVLIENHGLKIILGNEKDRISEINNERENKKLTTFHHHPSWFYFHFTEVPPLFIGGQFYSYCLSFNRRRHAACFYKNAAPSLVLRCISTFWKVSSTSKKPCLTFKPQIRVANKLDDVGSLSSEILSNQPDTLCSMRATSDLHFLNERFDLKLKRWKEPKYLLTEDSQDLINTDSISLGLPLSQGFAFQLVKLFGSPGVPMESLLPDDYVVPLDGKTLKMIYLQWKTSVEKRQKKIGLKNENSLNVEFSCLPAAAEDPDHLEKSEC